MTETSESARASVRARARVVLRYGVVPQSWEGIKQREKKWGKKVKNLKNTSRFFAAEGGGGVKVDQVDVESGPGAHWGTLEPPSIDKQEAKPSGTASQQTRFSR